jgi:Uma2 family endonuclease
MMAPAGFDHGATIINIAVLLAAHVKKHKLGVVLGAETGFILARDPDTVRGADVAFVRAARLEGKPRPKSFWVGAPDLAVEVLSPDDRPGEVKQKVNDYLAAGALLVWVVDPKRKSVTVHRPNQGSEVLRASETLHGEHVVPGFKCKVADVFE